MEKKIDRRKYPKLTMKMPRSIPIEALLKDEKTRKVLTGLNYPKDVFRSKRLSSFDLYYALLVGFPRAAEKCKKHKWRKTKDKNWDVCKNCGVSVIKKVILPPVPVPLADLVPKFSDINEAQVGPLDLQTDEQQIINSAEIKLFIERLPKQQKRVLNSLLNGKTIAEISKEMNLKPKTIEYYRRVLKEKFYR